MSSNKRFQVQVSSDAWAGYATNGAWVPAVDGAYNGSRKDAAEASTFVAYPVHPDTMKSFVETAGIIAAGHPLGSEDRAKLTREIARELEWTFRSGIDRGKELAAK